MLTWHREIERITNEAIEKLKGMWGVSVTGHLIIKEPNAQTQTDGSDTEIVPPNGP